MQYLAPEFIVAAGVLCSMVVVMLWPRLTSGPFWMGLIFLLAAGVNSATLWGTVARSVWHQALIVDPYAFLIALLVIAAGISTLLLSWDGKRFGPEFPPLVLLSVLGMMTLGIAANLIMLFIGIELLSLPLYILCAGNRTVMGGEAGLKYLLLGAFSSGILLFGMALIFGATGTLSFMGFAHGAGSDPMLLGVGLMLLLVGLGFKLAIVPFHMWVPDVYQGASTPVTNLMAFGTKVGAVAALLRVLAFGFYVHAGWWGPLLGYLAVLTMIVGNLLAVPQRDLKRLLGYSGIGHAGFLLIGLATHNFLGAMATLFYLIPYGLAAIGAFAVIRMVEGEGEGVSMDDLAGMAYRRPVVAALFIVIMLSFAGIPLTGGFIGKFYLVQAALVANQPGLAIGLVVGTLIGILAYLRPLQTMFRRDPSDAVSGLKWSVAGGVVLWAAVVGTIGLGVYPTPFVHMVNQSAGFFWLHP